jgi:hypothetical protein
MFALPRENKNNTSNDIVQKRVDHFFKPLIQRKLSRNQSDEANVSIENYVNSINDSGKTLDESTKKFFEPRFGRDFSDVRIHDDSEAAKSAQSINALAYTIGNNIVFNQNQFSTKSENGKKLLAHELTHVVQNNNDNVRKKNKIISRAITYTNPSYTREDPIPKVLGGTVSTLGKTYPKFNGHQMNTVDEALHALFDAFSGNLLLVYDNSAKACKVDMQSINLDVSSNVQKLTAPVNHKWSGSYSGSIVQGCHNKATVNIEMTSSPHNADAFEKRIADDEAEHVSDLNRLAHQHFDRFYTYLSNISLPSQTGTDCAALFTTEIGTKDGDMMRAFVRDWQAAVASHDDPGKNHHHSTTTNSGNCSLVKIVARF